LDKPKKHQQIKQLKTYGFHFRIPKKFDKQLKALDGDYLVVVSSGIRWTTSALKHLHEEYTDLTSSMSSMQSTIVKDAVKVACTHMPLVEMAASVIAELDVLCALAQVASQGILLFLFLSTGDTYFSSNTKVCRHGRRFFSPAGWTLARSGHQTSKSSLFVFLCFCVVCFD